MNTFSFQFLVYLIFFLILPNISRLFSKIYLSLLSLYHHYLRPFGHKVGQNYLYVGTAVASVGLWELVFFLKNFFLNIRDERALPLCFGCREISIQIEISWYLTPSQPEDLKIGLSLFFLFLFVCLLFFVVAFLQTYVCPNLSIFKHDATYLRYIKRVFLNRGPV